MKIIKDEIMLNNEFVGKDYHELAVNDKRWNSLFLSFPKTYTIKRYEKSIYKLINEKKCIISRKNDMNNNKKECLEKILSLTDKVHSEKDESAYKEMTIYKCSVDEINEGITTLEKQIESIDYKINETNHDLLKETVLVMYKYLSKSKRKIEKLDNHIEKYRKLIRQYIVNKQDLESAQSDTYKYLHNLIGAEEAERLDKIFLEGANS